MRIAFAVLFALSLVTHAEAADVSAESRVDTVTVFPSGAEVSRIARVKLDKGEHVVIFSDVPAQAVPGSIRVDGKANGKLEIGSVDTRRLFVPRTDQAAADADREKVENEIELLSDQRVVLDGDVQATETQKALINNLTNLPGRPAPPSGSQAGEDWGKVISMIGTSYADVQRRNVEATSKIRVVDRQLDELRKKLAALAPKREERTEVKIMVSAGAPLEADLTVRYQVPGASWQPYYDARLASGTKTVAPKLELTRRASISQRTGEAWDGVALVLSTTRPASGTSAPELQSVTVDFEAEAKPKTVAAPAPMMRSAAPRGEAMSAPPETAAEATADSDGLGASSKIEAVSEQSAVVETAQYQVLFAVPGRVTVEPTGEAKRVQLAQDSFEPILSVRSIPKLDPKAYLYAKLPVPKGSPLLPGAVSLFRDGTFVGSGRLPQLAGGEEHELGFGADDLVRVRYAVAEEKRGETGLISSSRTDERDYRITTKNLHERAVQLTILDQMPVSQNQEIKVELTGRTAPTKKDVDEKRGTLAWEMKLEPDEEKVIEFGYRVSWPAAKSIVYGR